MWGTLGIIIARAILQVTPSAHHPLTTHSPTHHSPLTSHLSPLPSHLSPLTTHHSPLTQILNSKPHPIIGMYNPLHNTLQGTFTNKTSLTTYDMTVPPQTDHHRHAVPILSITQLFIRVKYYRYSSLYFPILSQYTPFLPNTPPQSSPILPNPPPICSKYSNTSQLLPACNFLLIVPILTDDHCHLLVTHEAHASES